MVAEKGKATHRRSVYGCQTGERFAFYNIIWPLPLEERDERDAEEKKPFDTLSNTVPLLFFDKGQEKRKGTAPPEIASYTAKKGVPFLSAVEDAEPDDLQPEYERFTV